MQGGVIQTPTPFPPNCWKSLPKLPRFLFLPWRGSDEGEEAFKGDRAEEKAECFSWMWEMGGFVL